jgi:hypothetical protein
LGCERNRSYRDTQSISDLDTQAPDEEDSSPPESGDFLQLFPKEVGMMKTRNVMLTIMMCFIGLTVCFAASPMIGTWKLNEAKSKIGSGATKNSTVVYEAAGDSIKCTIDGVDAQGKAVHIEWTGKFDGKDYPLTGDPNGDMRSYKKINDRTMDGITKKDGKVTGTSRIAVSADGKTRTVTSNLTDSMGMKTHNLAFYDKQ